MKINSIITLFVIASQLFGQGKSTGSSYLKFPLSARLASMGEAGVADKGNFSTAFINPAGLFLNGNGEITLSHSEWIQDIRSEMLGSRISVPFGTVGIILSNTNINGIEVREIPGDPIAITNAHNGYIQLIGTTTVTTDIAVGVSIKYIYEKIFTDEATGYGFDAGVIYKTPIEGMTAGASFTNIGSMQAFRSQRSGLPSAVRSGIQYKNQIENYQFLVTTDVKGDLNLNLYYLHLGGEVTFSDFISARAGFQTGYESRGLSAGLGIQYSLFKLDYAVVPFSMNLGTAHILTLGFVF
jgi:hypothetical protein